MKIIACIFFILIGMSLSTEQVQPLPTNIITFLGNGIRPILNPGNAGPPPIGGNAPINNTPRVRGWTIGAGLLRRLL
jgi:hypothetical protein